MAKWFVLILYVITTVVILGIAMTIDFGLTMSGINASFFENLGYSRFPFR